MADLSVPYIEVRQKHRQFILTALPVWMLTKIAYASMRGRDDEEGAVQRVLNTRRISSIKEYTLQVGDYPASVVLNWINRDKPLVKRGGMVNIGWLDFALRWKSSHRFEKFRYRLLFSRT